ncbi:MAG: hypothetical protein ICV77_07000, partial [Cyanobacteria bacterium Co-bin8]|nr:hypothetical protein [Cyanobacteria bacterium Co-bin8]
ARSTTNALYTGGSGTNTLVFSYTVRTGDANLDLNYASTGALTIGEGGAIVDAAGNQGVLTLPGLGSEGSLGVNKNLLIQGFEMPKLGVFNNTYFNFNLYTRLENLNTGSTERQIEVGGINLAMVYDETYYLSQNPDVAAGIQFGLFNTGFEHFAQFGWQESRSPSALYDERYYLSQNPDIGRAVALGVVNSGLQHFLLHGHKEGRNFSPLFNQQDYLTNNSDVSDAVAKGVFGSAFEHYVEFGALEGRGPSLSLYNDGYYLQQNPDVAAAVANGTIRSGLDHFISYGQGEGRAASPLFNEASYLALNSDVQGAVQAGGFASGFKHYIEYGRAEGRAVFG